MASVKEIVDTPTYDSEASGASKASIVTFLLTVGYMIFFSGVDIEGRIVGLLVFILVGIFAVSLVVAMPFFILKKKWSSYTLVLDLASMLVTIWLTFYAYTWMFS